MVTHRQVDFSVRIGASRLHSLALSTLCRLTYARLASTAANRSLRVSRRGVCTAREEGSLSLCVGVSLSLPTSARLTRTDTQDRKGARTRAH